MAAELQTARYTGGGLARAGTEPEANIAGTYTITDDMWLDPRSDGSWDASIMMDP